MPLEIRELVIKAKVSGTDLGGSSTGLQGGKSLSEGELNEIVERVFELIKKHRER